MIEVWKDVPGFDGKYQVNTEGVVRSMRCPKNPKILKPFRRKNDPRYFVTLRKDGKVVYKSVMHLVSRTFLGEPPKGFVAYHKNGCQTENHLNNIGYINKKILCSKSAKQHRKTVCKIDKNGEIVEYYGSAGEAALANGYTKSNICRYCRGDTKNLFSPDGYAYFYDENEHGLKILINRIKRECGNA